jgi:hypothetical protein
MGTFIGARSLVPDILGFAANMTYNSPTTALALERNTLPTTTTAVTGAAPALARETVAMTKATMTITRAKKKNECDVSQIGNGSDDGDVSYGGSRKNEYDNSENGNGSDNDNFADEGNGNL